MENLLCTVKKTSSEDGKTACSVFMLQDPMELVGKEITQIRVEERIGTWRVLESEKRGRELVLERLSGDVEIEPCDAFYVDLPEPVVIVPGVRAQFEQAYVFSGKNWKLATEKKWQEKVVNVGGFERVGETRLRGKPHRVLKGPEFFAAVLMPDESSVPDMEHDTDSG